MPLTFIFIFIYICQPQVFAAARGLLSGCGAPSLVLDVSVVGAAQASLLPDMWDISSLTRDWATPPALEGGFLTTGPPQKSPTDVFVSLGPEMFYSAQNG